MSKKKHLEIYRTTKKVTEPDEVPPTGPTKLRDYTLIVRTTTEAFGVNKIQPPAETWHQSLERACTTNCRISAAVLVILFICSLVVFGGFFEPPRMFIYCVMGSIACVHTVNVREVKASMGAGMIVAICGDIMTIPGLPTRPGFVDVDYDFDTERIVGLF